MSRGFVKENDQEEVPLVPPRAELPSGTTNHVIQAGVDRLKEKKNELLNKQNTLTSHLKVKCG